jgi:hypothetical protein
MKSQKQSVNLLELKPKRNLQWETREGGLVTLVVPKFTSAFSRKWIIPMLAKPDIKVKLDAFGSFVWRNCDGSKTVREIGEEMAAAFGQSLEEWYERIGTFLAKLEKSKFVELKT